MRKIMVVGAVMVGSIASGAGARTAEVPATSDVLMAQDGNDILIAPDGNDILVAPEGNDTL